jgi:haloalkane dehalogenase
VEFVRTPEDRLVDLPGYVFEPHHVALGDGLRMHYVDEGPTTGEPVLLLHGQPTWSYLYRTVIPVLAAEGYRVIAPDLIGFGRSDKPTRRTDYSVRSHIAWLGEVVTTLDLTALTVVAQDWGGPLGLGAFSAMPERLARVAATNTVLHTADAALAGALTWACHSTAGGEVVVAQELLDYQRLTQELPTFQPSLFVQGATIGNVATEALAAYDAPFPDESFCAGARQLPLLMGLTPGSECARRNRRTMEFLRSFSGPFLVAFSDGDPSTQGWDAVLQRMVPGAEGQAHARIAGAGHFVQEDKGEELAGVIARFIGENPT